MIREQLAARFSIATCSVFWVSTLLWQWSEFQREKEFLFADEREMREIAPSFILASTKNFSYFSFAQTVKEVKM